MSNPCTARPGDRAGSARKSNDRASARAAARILHDELPVRQTNPRKEATLDHTSATPEPPGISEVATRLREDFGMLRTALGRERADLEVRLRQVVEEHPVASVAVGFGVGYVLGGGLFSRRTLPVVGLALRLVAGELLGRGVGDLDHNPAAAH